jgi:hypothetical protein
MLGRASINEMPRGEERRGEERNKIKIDLADITRWCFVVFQRGVALATNGTPSTSRGDFQIRR